MGRETFRCVPRPVRRRVPRLFRLSCQVGISRETNELITFGGVLPRPGFGAGDGYSQENSVLKMVPNWPESMRFLQKRAVFDSVFSVGTRNYAPLRRS